MSRLGRLVRRSAIPIALSSASLSLFLAIMLLDVALDRRALHLFLIVLLATLAVYGLDRWLEERPSGRRAVPGDAPPGTRIRPRWAMPWLCAILALYAGAVALAALSTVPVLAVVVASPLIVVCYSTDSPLYGGRWRFAIKRVPLAKDLYIAAGWTFLGPLALLHYESLPTAPDCALLGLMFVKLLIMASLYDFKDVTQDRREGTWTLQVAYGERRARSVLWALNGAATLGFLALALFPGHPTGTLLMLPLALYQHMLIVICREDASEWVFLGLCDLEQTVWLLALIAWGAVLWD
jgi:4-hydroxybenzoate polyprenyltransferase